MESPAREITGQIAGSGCRRRACLTRRVAPANPLDSVWSTVQQVVGFGGGSMNHVLFALVALSAGCSPEASLSDIVYPEPGSLSEASGRGFFRFGAASAATQIEDANVNTDWYVFTQPTAEGGLQKGEDFVGDASLGYTKAVEDVELLRQLNVDSYRFSIEWARIEPQRDVIDEEALAHYDELIDALVVAGIRPNVTVHHFSNPVWIDDPRSTHCVAGPSDENLCGLGHPVGGPLVVEEMRQHAALLAERFGDRVDDWGTVNEPVNYLIASQGLGIFPPGKNKLFDLLESFVPVIRDYVTAHAAMYRAIKAVDTIDADGDGQAASVGLALSVAEWVPAEDNMPSDDPIDVAAASRMRYVYHYLLIDSLRNGTFDANLDGQPDEEQPDWMGTVDWLGLQYYFRTGVTGHNGLIPVIDLTPCSGGNDFGSCIPAVDTSYCVPAMAYEFWAPGIYNVLVAFAARYPGLPLIVSEGGIATTVGERRAENIVRSLEQVERARAAGVDVRGYYHWSLYDNFEWHEGFGPRFGLYTVDYENYQRSPTEGATVMGEIAGARVMTAAQRSRYGGDGPMTAEVVENPFGNYCN